MVITKTTECFTLVDANRNIWGTCVSGAGAFGAVVYFQVFHNKTNDGNGWRKRTLSEIYIWIAFHLILPSCLFIKFYTKLLVSILDVSSVKGCSKVCKLKTFTTFCTSYYDYFTLLNRTVVLKFRDTTSIHRYISNMPTSTH